MLKWVYEFDQEKLLALQTEENKITPADVLILHSVVNSICSVKMQTIFEDDRVYVWIDHKHLLEALPILNIGSRQLTGLMKKYRALGLILTKTVANHNLRGSKSFIALSDSLIDCLSDKIRKAYDKKIDTYTTDDDQAKKISHENRPSEKNCSSSNTQYSNNNKELSKDNSNNISKKQQFNFGKKSNKKSSTKKFTYQDCIACIDNFTDDESLRSALYDYLNLRLSMMKEKPMKLVQWESMLITLEKALKKSSADVTYEDIVRRAIERGYATFFPINNYSYSSGNVKNKPWEQGVKSETYTEEEKRELEKIEQEMIEAGEQVWY